MSETQPILMEWLGDGFRPASSLWQKRADAQFVVGERYFVEVRLERSEASHRQFFAAVNGAWQNLPDHLAERFKSPDHLRKYALITSGFADERAVVCSSPTEAEKVAAFVRPADSYAVVTVSGNVVRMFTAKSQSYRSMDKTTFAASKRAVLDVLANLIGVTPAQLSGNEAA